ncbi:MAG TPA: hypothetical protein VKG26_09025 [Bacteroidia bacterium]|nr:hypothetical protein [Bacteroidia bacterium]
MKNIFILVFFIITNTYALFSQTNNEQKFKISTEKIDYWYGGKKDGTAQLISFKSDSTCYLSIHSGHSCWNWWGYNIKVLTKNDTVIFHFNYGEKYGFKSNLDKINDDEIFVFKNNNCVLVRISESKIMANKYKLEKFSNK